MSEKFGCHNCKWEDSSTMDEPCYSCNDNGDMIDGVPTNWTKKYVLAAAQETAPCATQIRDSGERTVFETGAVRDMHGGKGRMDLLPWRGIIEVSRHCEEGAKKYGEHNVDRGIPIHSLCDSAARHLAKYLIGMDDEPHLRAAAWNLLWALEMEIAHPELQDIPSRKEGKA